MLLLSYKRTGALERPHQDKYFSRITSNSRPYSSKGWENKQFVCLRILMFWRTRFKPSKTHNCSHFLSHAPYYCVSFLILRIQNTKNTKYGGLAARLYWQTLTIHIVLNRQIHIHSATTDHLRRRLGFKKSLHLLVPIFSPYFLKDPDLKHVKRSM